VNVIGNSNQWANLIDSLVPEILALVIATWEGMPSPSAYDQEDDITNALCKALKNNRTARGLMFQIQTQMVELEPMAGEDNGRLDIAFVPLIPREDIYFCLECKRLNVVKDGKRRTYASEYVLLGMLRFVTGQYSKAVHHGGMMGYVLDGNIPNAVTNVEGNIHQQQAKLCVGNPATFLPSSVLINEARARETRHQRAHESVVFRIHHLFMAPH
jgi:hypothetical protein